MSETAQHRGGASGYREGAGRTAHRTKPTTRYRRRAAPAWAARGTFGLLQTARDRGPPYTKRNSERMLEPEGECGAAVYRASDTAKPKAPTRHEACNAHTAPEGRVGGRPRRSQASMPGGTVAAASSKRGDTALAAPNAIASVSSAAIAR